MVAVAQKFHLAHVSEHCRVVVVAQVLSDLLRSLWRRSLGDKVLIVLLGHWPIRKLQRLIEFGGGLDDWGFRAGVARTVTHMLFDVGKSLSVACVSPTSCKLARVLLVLGAEDFPLLLTCREGLGDHEVKRLVRLFVGELSQLWHSGDQWLELVLCPHGVVERVTEVSVGVALD